MVELTIDGVKVQAKIGTTVLEAAAAAGVEIPNLCYRKRLGAYGACGVCVVEVKGQPKLLRACSAKVAPGMEVVTSGGRADSARRLALELMMSDHDGDCIGPCKLNCPAHTDCQKYVREIAEGRYADAVSTIFEVFPFPSSIGRVCPHPCEQECRRRLVEAPISIAHLKAFAGDRVRADGTVPAVACAVASGKSVGVIGGGPAGLTAAYHLLKAGHAVTVYDQMPEMGGMLRYGIPEYRLPKAVLKAETDMIASLGAVFVNGFKIGRDATLAEIRARHDALVVANGAWRSSSMRIAGEDLAGVMGGIDFLREVATGGRPAIGRRVAVVGGGNTAMDACRTAIRLGAEEVFVLYRRTRDEMPAEEIEIREAEEEGVVYKFLRAPLEVLGENNRVSAIRLQKMVLGEPDAQGRRRPVPVEGETETLAVDSVIVAIGQRNDPDGFDDLAVTKWGTIVADRRTFATAIDGIFACGDAVNDGAGIAIGAIAQANEAARAVDAYLKGAVYAPSESILSKRTLTKDDFADHPRAERSEMPHRSSEERKRDFGEVNLGLDEAAARKEAKRCLECGCHDYADCRLIRYANRYRASADRLKGEYHPGFTENRLVTIERNQRKCILCNLCVRTCEQEAGEGILGLVGRGFETVVKPEFAGSERIAVCKDCHRCADVCPTGALKLLGGQA